MDSRQSVFFQMCAAVKATVNAHTTAWSTYLPFANPYNLFLQSLSEADLALALQEKSSVGTTEQKNLAREKLTIALNQLMNVLVQYSVETNNLQLRRDAYMSISDMNRLSEKALVGHAVKLKGLVPTPIPSSISNPPAGIDTNFMAKLQILLDEFINSIGTPRHIIAESMRGTEELLKHEENMRKNLELMDIAMSVLQYTQTAFYSEYTNSRALIDSGSSTRALTVKIIDANTSAPLPNAKCVIALAEIDKLSGEQGIIYVQSLKAGEYKLEVSKAGYESVAQSFVMDEVGGLSIELRLIPNE